MRPLRAAFADRIGATWNSSTGKDVVRMLAPDLIQVIPDLIANGNGAPSPSHGSF
jgi:hypothetical protein